MSRGSSLLPAAARQLVKKYPQTRCACAVNSDCGGQHDEYNKPGSQPRYQPVAARADDLTRWAGNLLNSLICDRSLSRIPGCRH